MDKDRFTYYLDAIKEFNEESDDFNDHIKAISMGGFSELGFDFLDYFIELLSESVGDTQNWIYWFVFEDEFGANGYEAGYDGGTTPIKTVDDLWQLIEEGKEDK